MTPIKTSGMKKDELIQLRVEKSFADQLNALADRKQVPLSVMLRMWMAEKLEAAGKAELAKRSAWVEERIKNIKTEGFAEGPLLVMHAFSTAANAKLRVDILKQYPQLVVPGHGHRRMTSEILQHGLSAVVRQGDEKVVARGEAFKTGELEFVCWAPSEEDQLYGLQLDSMIVNAVQGLCAMYKKHEIDVSYVIRTSLLNAEGLTPVTLKVLASNHKHSQYSSNKIDLPEITITSPDQLSSTAKTAESLIDVLDELWHAAGQECSPSFDHNLKWAQK